MSQTTLDIKEPGLNVLPPGVERHVVNAGGLTGLQIFPDDEIEIINDEGNQICEIICFDKDGKSENGILNLKENAKESFIKEILLRKDESSLITNLQLKKRNLNINKSNNVKYNTCDRIECSELFKKHIDNNNKLNASKLSIYTLIKDIINNKLWVEPLNFGKQER